MKYLASVIVVVWSVASWGSNVCRRVDMMPGENWWGAANAFSTKMPFTAATRLTMDLRKDNFSNQTASLLLSDRGRVIWSEAQAKFEIADGRITVESSEPVLLESSGESTLRGAYRHAMLRWFPPCGKSPDPLFFTAPQLNTWIELRYDQNQRDILAYARQMREKGVPPGVLMIDDTWQTAYGDWRFEGTRFPDPKGMMDELHRLGYRVMLWMCPYVGMDTPAFRRIAWGYNPADVRGYPTKGGFLTDRATGKPKACEWWNGYSAFLDFSHPNANAWFAETLDGLVRNFGADGFKFDGGDICILEANDCMASDRTATSGSFNRAYAAYAEHYPFCEFRNAWRLQQRPVVTRLGDKHHRWADLRRCVADMIGAGLLGCPFVCPDMVGGGQWMDFLPGAAFDPELFVRSAQMQALCPMMQISASPWRVLDERHQRLFSAAVALRQRFAPSFAALAKRAGETGEPILRNLEYDNPGLGYASVRDEFLMGTELLVAPQMEKGAASRKVLVPPGRWRSDDGLEVTGPTAIEVATPLSRIPHFVRSEGSLRK